MNIEGNKLLLEARLGQLPPEGEDFPGKRWITSFSELERISRRIEGRMANVRVHVRSSVFDSSRAIVLQRIAFDITISGELITPIYDRKLRNLLLCNFKDTCRAHFQNNERTVRKKVVDYSGSRLRTSGGLEPGSKIISTRSRSSPFTCALNRNVWRQNNDNKNINFFLSINTLST